MSERNGYREMRFILSFLLAGVLECTALSNVWFASDLPTAEVVQPHIAHLKLKADDLRTLTARQVVSRSLPTKSSKVMAGFAAVLADATPDAFLDSYRSLAVFNQNRHTIACGRFSPTPAMADLDGLVIDNKEIYALYKARPRAADMKLTEAEIARFQAIVGPAERLTPQIKSRIAAEYKKMMVERVKAYLASGAAAMGSFMDKDEPVDAHEAFVALAHEQRELGGHCQHLFPSLERYPTEAAPDSDSFVYWAKQRFGRLKPVINLVHVMIHKCGGRIFIASKQLYSSHYTEAGLSLAEIIPFSDGRGHSRTIIAYSIRLQVDMLGGSFGFMKKRMAQPHLLETLKESLNGLRVNMEATANRGSGNNKVGS